MDKTVELNVRGCSMFCEISGDGEPVVLLHGGCADHRQWRTLVATLSPRFSCFTPDFYGHGSSSRWPHSRSPTLDDHAEIVSAIADLAGRPLHLVGHSHGGAVAVTYAKSRLATLSSLTLIEPTLMHLLRTAGECDVWREAEELGLRHIEAVATGHAATVAEAFLTYWAGERAWREMTEARRRAIIETMPAVGQFWAAALAETTPAEAYRALTVPTLLLRGAKSRAPGRQIVDLLARLLPRSKILEIEGAGHTAPLMHADAVNAMVAAHIEKHRIGE